MREEVCVRVCVFGGGWEHIEIAMKVTLDVINTMLFKVCSFENVSFRLLLIVGTEVSVLCLGCSFHTYLKETASVNRLMLKLKACCSPVSSSASQS